MRVACVITMVPEIAQQYSPPRRADSVRYSRSTYGVGEAGAKQKGCVKGGTPEEDVEMLRARASVCRQCE